MRHIWIEWSFTILMIEAHFMKEKKQNVNIKKISVKPYECHHIKNKNEISFMLTRILK